MSRSLLRLGGVIAAIVVGGVWAGVFAWALATQAYNVWGAVVLVPVIVALNAALARRVSRRLDEPWLAKLLAIALAAKILGTLVRYFFAYVVYDGAADAERYNLYAAANYEQWRQGTITLDVTGPQGTHYMELITTAIYTVVGPSPIVGFLVFASFAFWGQYLLFRAFRTALPHGDGRRYAFLVFLLPSMLYWPSSIGKESWLMLFVGVTALGASKFFAGKPGGLRLLAVGALGTGIVRPHIALMLFGGLSVAQLFRPTGARAADTIRKFGGIVVLGAVALVLVTQSAEFLGIDDLDWQAISETFAYRSDLTEQGGSAFTPVPITSIVGIPIAAFTVLFRPLPWEAENVQLLLQSLEGLFLLALTVRAWPRLRRLPSILRHNPYVVFTVVYASVFIFVFAGFGNFGVLARQRVLMLPLFLVLLALPRADQAGLARGAKETHELRR